MTAKPEFVVGMETSGSIRDAIEALGYPAISVDRQTRWQHRSDTYPGIAAAIAKALVEACT